MADQLTVEQFAQKIRTKYPAYQGVADEKLARAFVAKYPAYASQVNFGAAAKTAPAIEMSAAPKVGSGNWWKGKAYTYADKALPLLPAIGGTVGGILGAGSGGILGAGVGGVPGGILGSIEGGVIGEGARTALTRLIFNKDPEHMEALPHSGGEFAKNLAVQGALMGGTEALTRGVAAPLLRLARPFEQSAATVAAADAAARFHPEGAPTFTRTVRMTPGEATGNSMLKRAERVLRHIPGASGPIETFREAQAQDATGVVQQQLSQLSRERIPPEQLGQQVQGFVQSAGTHVDAAYQAEYQQSIKRLGIDPAMSHEAAGKSAQQALQGAYRGMETEEARLSDVAKKGIDAEYQQSIKRLGIDPAMSHEAAGKSAQQALQGAYRDVEAEETRLYDAAKKGLGREGQHVTPEEFDQAIARHTEPRTLQPPAGGNGLGLGKPVAAPLRGYETAAGRDLAAARNYTKANRPVYDAPLIARVLNTNNPEAVSRYLQTASLGDVRALQKMIPLEAQHQLGQSLLTQMATASRSEAGEISGKKLVARLAKFGDERGQVIYGPERWKEINATAERMRTVEEHLGRNLQAAQNYTSANRAVYDAPLIARVLNTNNPEAVSRYLQTASLGDVRALQKMIPLEAQHQLGQSLLSQMATASRNEAGEISGKKLAARLAKFGDERGQVIYGPERWKEINATAERMRTVEENLPKAREAFTSDLMRKIATSGKPEAVSTLFQGASVADIRSLMGAMPAPMRQKVSADVLQGLIARDAQSGNINARALAVGLKDLGEGRGRLIFGAQYDAIKDASEAFNRIAPMTDEGGGMAQMHTIRTILELGSIAGTLVGAGLGHATSTAASLGGSIGAMRLIGYALTHPATSAKMLKAVRIAATMGTRSMPYLVDEFGRDQKITTPYQDYRDSFAPPPNQ